MNKLPSIQLPLYGFFEALRKNGFSLGLQEYYDLLQALHYTQGIDLDHQQIDREALLAVCKILWFKPQQSLQVFENLYRETFEDFIWSEEISETPSAPETSTPSNNENAVDPTSKEKPSNDKEKTQAAQQAPSPPEDENQTLAHPEATTNEEATNVDKKIKFVIRDVPAEDTPGSIDDSVRIKLRKFLHDPYVFRVTPRQMLQACRFLPMRQAFADGQQLDIDQMVTQYAQHGFFTRPVFKTYNQTRNQVLLLIDHGGSMAALGTLANTMIAALDQAFQVSPLAKEKETTVKKYYFYNTPHGHVYQDRAHIKAVSLKDLQLQIKQMPQTLIFILSDAGAARGGNNDGRFQATLDFLLLLKKMTHKVVWLNPMPKKRWHYTTAERIGQWVAMYALDAPNHLKEAIAYLKKY